MVLKCTNTIGWNHKNKDSNVLVLEGTAPSRLSRHVIHTCRRLPTRLNPHLNNFNSKLPLVLKTDKINNSLLLTKNYFPWTQIKDHLTLYSCHRASLPSYHRTTVCIRCIHIKQHVCFTFMWPCIATNFFIIKPTRCTNFPNLLWHETLHVSDSSSAYRQEFIHCTLSNGICHTGL